MLVNLISDLDFLSAYAVVCALNFVYLVAIYGSFCYAYLPRSKRDGTWKTQVEWPNDKVLWNEFLMTPQTVWGAALCPTVALWLQARGYNMLYSTAEFAEHGVLYFVFSTAVVVLLNEAFQWAWHYACHMYQPLWAIHKTHHIAANPTPLSTLVNDPLDLLVQTSSFIWMPLVMPLWDVTLFGTFSAFVFWGTWLHSGFEASGWASDPHQNYINTSWHHNTHHHYSNNGNPFNMGFFFQFMDHIFGTYHAPHRAFKEGGTCACPHCRADKRAVAQEKGNVEEEHALIKAQQGLKQE